MSEVPAEVQEKAEEEEAPGGSVDASPQPGVAGIPIFEGKPLKKVEQQPVVEKEVESEKEPATPEVTPDRKPEVRVEPKPTPPEPQTPPPPKPRLSVEKRESSVRSDKRTTTPRTKKPASTRSGSATASVARSTVSRKPPADQRGCVFKSSTQRFRTGDVMSGGGVALISSTAEDSTDGKQSSKRVLHSKGSPPRYSTNVQGLRKRYPRPVRHSVERWGDRAECIGKMTCSARCMVVADSTVWCAEADGSISIREKDGTVFAVVERDHNAPQITSMLYLPSGNKGGRILVGHQNGTVLALDATTAERLTNDAPFHTSSITCLAAVYHNNTSSLVVSASKEGSMRFFDGHTLEVLQSVSHPDAVTCVVPSGPYTYTGCLDGYLRKWDTQTGIELSSTMLSGPIQDIVLDGRCLWCCVSGAQQLFVVDVCSMSIAAHPHPPTPASATKVLLVGSALWTFHTDGTIVVWNSQTLECVRTIHSSDNSIMLSACRVATVPEDFEVWTLSDSQVQMWRNHEYTLPLWCHDAYQAWQDNVSEVKDEVAQLKQMLALKNEKITQLEHMNEKLKDDLLQANQLQASVQSLASTRKDEVGVENERRKKIEAELCELRQTVIDTHKGIAPPEQHLLHYKTSELQNIVLWLANEYSTGLSAVEAQLHLDAQPQDQSLQEDFGEVRDLLVAIHRNLTPPADHKEVYTPQDLADIVRLVEARAAHPPVENGSGDAADELVTKNTALREDNTRLKEMLEKLKSSHKRVNAQLQALSQQHIPA